MVTMGIIVSYYSIILSQDSKISFNLIGIEMPGILRARATGGELADFLARPVHLICKKPGVFVGN